MTWLEILLGAGLFTMTCAWWSEYRSARAIARERDELRRERA